MVSEHASNETLATVPWTRVERHPVALPTCGLTDPSTLRTARSSYAYAAQRAISGSNSNRKTTSLSSYKRSVAACSLTHSLDGVVIEIEDSQRLDREG